MFGDQFKGNQSSNEKGAIPEARRTKREILQSRQVAKREMANFNKNRYKQHFDRFRMAVIGFFQDVEPFIPLLEENGKDYSDLKELYYKPESFESWEEIDQEHINYYREKFYRLNKLIHDLGITDIALEKNKKPYGYEFMKGLSQTLNRPDPGWMRLKENIMNMRRLQRKDVDIAGVIYGPNRTGKSTLSLQIARMIENGENKGTIPEDHIIFDGEDFDHALKEHEQYSAEHIDEFSLLFHKRDGMKEEQKRRNKQAKTFSVKNFFLIGCENNYYNIDGEFLSDKVKFAIEVPERGKFRFFSKAKLSKFSKGKDSNLPDTPEPDFTGSFPNLDPDNGKTDELWEVYEDLEHKKMELAKEDDEEETINYEKMIKKVIEEEESYKKELEGRDDIINWRKIKMNFNLSRDDAKAVKDEVEDRLDY